MEPLVSGDSFLSTAAEAESLDLRLTAADAAAEYLCGSLRI